MVPVFEELARDAAPDAARVACIPEAGVVGGVRLLVVPHVAGDDLGRIEHCHDRFVQGRVVHSRALSALL